MSEDARNWCAAASMEGVHGRNHAIQTRAAPKQPGRFNSAILHSTASLGGCSWPSRTVSPPSLAFTPLSAYTSCFNTHWQLEHTHLG